MGTQNAPNNDPFSLGIIQIWLLGEDIWGKNCIFKDNIQGTQNIPKNDPFSVEIVQIWLIGEEILGKNCIFEDNLTLSRLKHLSLRKMTPFSLGIFKSDYLERR